MHPPALAWNTHLHSLAPLLFHSITHSVTHSSARSPAHSFVSSSSSSSSSSWTDPESWICLRGPRPGRDSTAAPHRTALHCRSEDSEVGREDRKNKRVNEWTNKRMNERTNKRMAFALPTARRLKEVRKEGCLLALRCVVSERTNENSALLAGLAS